MKSRGKKKALRGLIIGIGAIYMAMILILGTWKRSVLVGGDSWGYYLYLPAGIIHSDLSSLDKTYTAREKENGSTQTFTQDQIHTEELHTSPIGHLVNKYTCGVAILQFPFFMMAHCVSKIGGFDSNGFGEVYLFFGTISSLFYFLMGLFVLGRVLATWYAQKVIFVALISISLASNILYFVAYNPMMAHSYLFFLHALFILNLVGWCETRDTSKLITLASSFAMIVLIRPAEVIFGLAIFMYGWSYGQRIGSFIYEKVGVKQLFWLCLVGFIVWLPQLMYWKWTTGSFFYYSYGAEGFNFLQPHIMDGLFGYKNGWLTYTPLMILALAGMYPLFKEKNPIRWPIMITLPIHIYITYSWWCWQYINGYGSRPMVEILPWMAIPLSGLIRYISNSKVRQAVYAFIVLVFAYPNFLHMFQMKNGQAFTEDSTRAFYWSTIDKYKIDMSDLGVYDSNEFQPDTNELEFVKVLYRHDFMESDHLDPLDSTQRVLFLASEDDDFVARNPWSNEVKGDYIRIKVRANKQYEGLNIYRCVLLTSLWKNENDVVKYNQLRLDNKIENTAVNLWGGRTNRWGEVGYFVRVPNHDISHLEVGVRNPHNQKMLIDDLQVEIWKVK